MEAPDELGNSKVTLSQEAIDILTKLFPDKSTEEAFQAYCDLATAHLKPEADDLKTLTTPEDASQ